ncbi:uncharacterized protein LOC123317121 [Coccinella septempunctata]|uniref:uncharacterized protein LOC123317121 n=1 Tax=Coccinella septempunctata TaxID=41139 RepID=UPI001D07B1B5|nr:uncharacterized protein LOC123317121 [Coccinella septempunctata]
MMSLLKNGVRSLSHKNSSRICITHRQCTLLFSILMFIFSAVFATCATLGYSHAEETLEILKSDIHIERERHEENGEKSSNEALLIKSQRDLRSNKYLLELLMQYGWILLVSSAILIYATATNSPILMLPFIVVGMWIYISLMFIGVLLYYDYIKGLNFINIENYVVPTFIASVIFIGMWTVILWYHVSLKSRRCSQPSAPKPKTVYTQEGLIHTVNHPKDSDQKKILV